MRRLTDREACIIRENLYISENPAQDPEVFGEEMHLHDALVKRGLLTTFTQFWEERGEEWEAEFYSATAAGRLALRAYDATTTLSLGLTQG